MDPAIRTQHLTKVYGNRVIAVNDMCLDIPQGVVFGLLGPNGAGKTTTLRLLLGLQRPSAGMAEVLGHRCGPGAVAVRGLIGYLPTNPKLPGHLRPIEYLDLLGQLCRLPSNQRKPRITSLLRAMGLLKVTDRRIQTLSTGETTRLGIAASLVADPPLLIWDEPTAGLDPAARRFTLDLIRELGANRTIVIATHILSDIDQICDSVGVMYEGRMIFCGSMREMKARLQFEDFTLELDASAPSLESLATEVRQVDGVAASVPAGRSLAVRVVEGQSRASVLQDVLQRVVTANLPLLAVRSGQHDTETAYLHLLQEEEAHGFSRFELNGRHASDAAAGDPAV